MIRPFRKNIQLITNTGYLLVAIQIFSLLYLLATGPFLPGNILSGLAMSVGLFLAFWSFFSMKWSNFRIHPIPRKSAKLIKSGPYYLIRHPMYTSLLLMFFPLLIEHSTWPRAIFFLFLGIALGGKIRIEEIELRKRFEDYQAYRRKTWYIIPGLI